MGLFNDVASLKAKVRATGTGTPVGPGGTGAGGLVTRIDRSIKAGQYSFKLGITVSRRGYTHARPPQEILEHARNFHKKT